MPKTASRRTPYHSSSRWRHEDWYSLQGLADAVGDVDDQQAMEGQALGRVDAERDHSRGRDRSTSTLASASPAILCGKEGRTLIRANIYERANRPLGIGRGMAL